MIVNRFFLLNFIICVTHFDIYSLILIVIDLNHIVLPFTDFLHGNISRLDLPSAVHNGINQFERWSLIINQSHTNSKLYARDINFLHCMNRCSNSMELIEYINTCLMYYGMPIQLLVYLKKIEIRVTLNTILSHDILSGVAKE